MTSLKEKLWRTKYLSRLELVYKKDDVKEAVRRFEIIMNGYLYKHEKYLKTKYKEIFGDFKK